MKALPLVAVLGLSAALAGCQTPSVAVTDHSPTQRGPSAASWRHMEARGHPQGDPGPLRDGSQQPQQPTRQPRGHRSQSGAVESLRRLL